MISELQSAPATSASAHGEPIDVLYLSGFGRCGSTVMESVLAGLPGFQAFGEVKYLWERGCRENVLCGCGREFWNCEFWPSLLRDVLGDTEPQTIARMQALDRECVSLTNLRRYLARQLSPGPATDRWNEYLKTMANIYRAMRERTSARVLVDSSKYSTYGLLLSRIPELRVHAIHLVRDSRASAFSWARKRQRPEVHWTTGFMPRFGLIGSTGRWYVFNRTSHLLEGRAANFRRIRYEDFVAHPGQVLTQTLEGFGLLDAAGKTQLEELERSRMVAPAPRHSVSGNPNRFATEPAPLKLDDEWRGKMSFGQRATVTALSWPLLRHYGYSL